MHGQPNIKNLNVSFMQILPPTVTADTVGIS